MHKKQFELEVVHLKAKNNVNRLEGLYEQILEMETTYRRWAEPIKA